jgi:vacuolar iron transporter family protein
MPGFFSQLRTSVAASAGTIVFGMEDGTVSIFGLVFGVAATTSSTAAVLIAGASGAAAAAVSMMAGAYLDAETDRDTRAAQQAAVQADMALDHGDACSLLPTRLAAVGLTPDLAAPLTRAIAHDPVAVKALLQALNHDPADTQSPTVQALWMLVADFLSAAVPIVPFILLPVPIARVVSGVITILLLVVLGVGRAHIGGRPMLRTVLETVAMGIAAALAGVGIGLAFDHVFG